MRYSMKPATTRTDDQWRELVVQLGWMADAYAEQGIRHRVRDCEIARATIAAQMAREPRSAFGVHTLSLSPMSKWLVHFAEYGDEPTGRGELDEAV